MNITREMIIKEVAKETDIYAYDVRKVLQSYEDVIMKHLNEVTDDEDVSVQVISGVKFSTHVVPERERIHPKTRETIIAKPTVKPACKFSITFKNGIQEKYESKNSK